MPHSKRTCRRSSRPAGRDPNKNYFNDKVARKAIKKQKMAKQARKVNRRK